MRLPAEGQCKHVGNLQMDRVGDTKAVLLVGGQGTRLRSVLSSTPKPLAPIGEQSFLELLVRQLQSQGIKRLIMCTGYLSDQIEKEFGDGSGWGMTVEYSQEHQLLGTAGALKLAKDRLLDVENFIVMNGDSFLEADLNELLCFHRERHGIASVAALRVPNAARYGTMRADESGEIVAFMEKTGDDRPGLINGGVYVFNKEILDYIPDGPASLEKDVFPNILKRGVYALEQSGLFIDIGTPEDYSRAQSLCKQLSSAALGRSCSSARRKQRTNDRQ